MKKDAISTGLFIAIGFLCVAIVIAILIPVVRDVVNDADDNRPVIPSVSEAQFLTPVQTEAALVSFNTMV